MPRHVQVDTSPLVKLSTLPDVIAAQKFPPEAMGTEVEEPHDSLATRDVVVFSVLCMYDFDSDEAGLLSFKKNEILDVVKRDESGWWAAMKQDGQSAPVVGWISRAYVSVLSEEMAEKLWNIEKQFRIPEYEAEMLYNSAPVNGSIIIDDTPSPSPSPLDDGRSQHFWTSTSTLNRNSLDKHGYGRSDENVNPYTSLRSLPTSFRSSTSVPLPPSRSASFKKTWKSQTVVSDVNTRPRAGSLTPSRSSQRQPMKQNEALSRLTNREIASEPQPVSKVPGSSLAGTFEFLYRRIGDDRMQRRKTGEGTSDFQATKPSHLRMPSVYSVDEDDKGRVRSGTLPAFVERLTNETPIDLSKKEESRTFTNIFLMTFRTFTTPTILFDMLVDRYNTPPPENLSDTHCIEWITHIRLPLRLRVLEVFGAWLEEHRLLDEEPYVARRLMDFLASLDDPALSGTAEAMLNALERLTFAIPRRPLTIVPPSKARKSKVHKNELLKLDSSDIAEQLTLLEFGLYLKITPQECLTYVKTKKGSAVANLVEFCSTHDKLASWVKTSVFNNDMLSKRADTVDFWIKVAEKCRVLNNFSSMCAIITALSTTALTQLQLTWAQVGRKSNLDSLLRHNEPTGGFSGYRTLLQQTDGPCVPFITMYLTDIIHAGEQRKQETDVILFYQRARWFEIITNILKFQSRPYRIAPSETTTNFIDTHLREALQDQSWFWQRSQELQRSEAAQVDIRKGLEAAGF